MTFTMIMMCKYLWQIIITTAADVEGDGDDDVVTTGSRT
jgi:hypothetical protein